MQSSTLTGWRPAMLQPGESSSTTPQPAVVGASTAFPPSAPVELRVWRLGQPGLQLFCLLRLAAVASRVLSDSYVAFVMTRRVGPAVRSLSLKISRGRGPAPTRANRPKQKRLGHPGGAGVFKTKATRHPVLQ